MISNFSIFDNGRLAFNDTDHPLMITVDYQVSKKAFATACAKSFAQMLDENNGLSIGHFGNTAQGDVKLYYKTVSEIFFNITYNRLFPSMVLKRG